MNAGVPDPAHNPTGREDDAGWSEWLVGEPGEFNRAVLGPMHVRTEGNVARVRLMPQPHHMNMNRAIHGGALLAFIDTAMFAGADRLLAKPMPGGATVEVTTHFVGPGDGGRMLDALIEVVRETGRMVFVRGTLVQEDDVVTSFSGILRKPR